VTDRAGARSAERYRLARRAVLLGGVEKVTVTLAALVRVPLLLWGLGVEQYGLYVAVLGVAATARLLDFGLHYGVLNAIAAARGRDDATAIRSILATALALYGAIALAALAVLVPLAARLPLDALLGVRPELLGMARLVVLIALVTLLAPMPLKVFSAALYGFQRQYVVATFNVVSTLGQLGLLAVVVIVAPRNLVWVAGAVLVSEALHWIVFAMYVSRRPELAVSRQAVSRRLAPALLSAGLAFFAINLANLMKFTLGSPIVSYALGPAAVPSFSVPLALFLAAQGLVDLVAASFWPAYGEAAARGEWSWVGRAFLLGTKAAIGLAGAFAVLGWLFGDQLIALWTAGAIAPSRTVLALFAVWLVAQAGVGAASVLLSGLERQRVVMWVVLAEGLLALVLAAALVTQHGVGGVVAAMALTASASSPQARA
jgi:O-antigen/teichoic acid export membrane protein